MDTADYSERTAPVTASIGGSADDGQAGERDTIATDVERIRGGSAGDHLTGSSAANVLYGGGGADTLVGLAGNDDLYGEEGADTIDARDGARDRLFCGSEVDTSLVDAKDVKDADCE